MADAPGAESRLEEMIPPAACYVVAIVMSQLTNVYLALLTPKSTHCLGYRDCLVALLEPGGDFMDNRPQGRGRELGCHRVLLRQGFNLLFGRVLSVRAW